MTSRWKRRAAVAAAGALLIAAAGVAAQLIPKAGLFCQKVVVPAYFYPGASWTRAIDSRPVPSAMILDITSSGAGSAPDRNYQRAIKQAKAAGIRIVGYANTDYSRRTSASVEADVRNYRAWYGVTDIFLDEVSSGGGGIPYYRRMAGYIHRVNPGSMVMLNPGTYPDEQYLSVGDVVVVYEDSYASYVKLDVPRWTAEYPAAKFAHIIYATSATDMASAISLSRRRHAGYVYVTGASGVNPYRSLPGYWRAEDAAIAAKCTGGWTFLP